MKLPLLLVYSSVYTSSITTVTITTAAPITTVKDPYTSINATDVIVNIPSNDSSTVLLTIINTSESTATITEVTSMLIGTTRITTSSITTVTSTAAAPTTIVKDPYAIIIATMIVKYTLKFIYSQPNLTI